MKQRIAIVCVLLCWLWARHALGQGLQPVDKNKATLRSAGAIVVNGKPLEKVVLTAESKGPIDWDYDEDDFPETRSEICTSDKKLVLFPIRSGTFRVRLLLWDEKKFQKITLVIIGEGPIPPGPTPPGPTPPKPPDTPVVESLGFVTLAKTETARLPTDARAYAGKIADNFESVAAKLAATANMTVEQANAELKTRHRGVVPDAHAPAWSAWFGAWKTHADGLGGMLSTRDSYVTAYQETAIGLRK